MTVGRKNSLLTGGSHEQNKAQRGAAICQDWLKWSGYAQTRDSGLGGMMLNIEPGMRTRGTPQGRFIHVVKDDMQMVTEEDARRRMR